MPKIISRTIGARTIAANTDQVMASVPVPPGGKVLSVQGEIHIVGGEGQLHAEFAAWGYSGHLVPVDDMETALDVQTLWDQVVVKSLDPTTSAGTATVDFDTDSADTSPEIEPGEMDINELLGMTVEEKELLPPQLRWMSWAKDRQGGFVAGSPDVYNRSDFTTFRSRRTLVADVASMAMIGVSNPLMDELVTAVLTPGTVGEWGILGNMDLAMEQLVLGQIGLTEVGAESPHAEIAGFISELAAPDMLDEATSIYQAAPFNCLMVCTWLLDLPETSVPNTIDGR